MPFRQLSQLVLLTLRFLFLLTICATYAKADCAGACNSPDFPSWAAAYTAECDDLRPNRDYVGPWGYVNQFDIGQGAIVVNYGCNVNHNPSDYYGTICCIQQKITGDPRPPSQPKMCPVTKPGSTVFPQDRSLLETIPLIGIPFDLVYSTSRIRNSPRQFALDIPAIPNPAPSDLVDATVTVQIAGRTYTQLFTTAGSIYHVVWDGMDATLASYVGQANAHIITSRHYSTGAQDIPIETDQIIGLPSSDIALGQWTVSTVHFYEIVAGRIRMGDGSVRDVKSTALTPSGYRAASADASEVYIFDGSGYHIQTLDGKTGAVTQTILYDSAHRIVSISDAFGNATVFNRNGSGVATSITGPYGQSAALTYDSNNQLASVTRADSGVFAIGYDSSHGWLHTFTKPSGEVSTITMDSYGALVSDVSSTGPALTYSQVDSDINIWGNNYTQNVETSAEGRTNTFTHYFDHPSWTDVYTSRGQSIQTYELPAGNTTGFSQATFNLNTNVQTSIGASYDARFGFQAALAGSRAVTNYQTRYENLYQILSPARTDDVAYPMADPFSYTTLESDRSINSQSFVELYTRATGDTKYTTPVGRISHIVTNSLGQVTQTKNASFAAASVAYDTHGRISQVAQGTRTSTFGYNTLGLLSSVTNAASQVTSYAYDLANRIQTVTLPDLRTINYTYDAGGNLASISTPGSTTHTFVNNLMNFPTSYHPPTLSGGGVDTQYVYNNDRQLTSVTRPDSSVVSLSYNSGTGLLESVMSGLLNQTLTYVNGLVSQTTSWDGVETYNSYSGTFATTVQYGGSASGIVYTVPDVNFNLSTFQIGSGTNYVLLYDNDGLLKKVGSETINRSVTTGLVSDTVVGNAREYYTYDSTYGELASYQAKYTTATNKFLESYARDALGRISTRIVTLGTAAADVYAYSYDLAGRLADVTKNSASIGHYVYDSNSNRTSSTNSAGTFTATYDVQDRLVTYGTKTFGYNLNGERTTQVDSSVSPTTTSYIWDALGNLKQVTLPAGTQIKYKYDGQNRKVTKMTGTTINERYVYLDQTRLLGVLNSSGATVMTFFYGVRNTPEYMIKSGTTYKLFVDHVGSVRQVVNASNGTVSQEITYDEFGRVLSDSSPGFQPFGFAGGLYDSATKLAQFGARWYDAEVGRWLSKDPVLFGGLQTNLYGYNWADPVNFIDPSGRSPIKGVVIATALTGLAGGAGAAAGALCGGASGPEIRDAFTSGFVSGSAAGLTYAAGGYNAISTAAGIAIDVGINFLTAPGALPSGTNMGDVKNGVGAIQSQGTK